MLLNLFLIMSVVLQIGTAFLAIRLISITGHRIAWACIAAGISLMAVRRFMSFYWLFSGRSAHPLDLTFEFVGFITSAAMFAGVYLIRPLFYEIKKSEETLREANEKLSFMGEERRMLLDNTRDMVYRHDTNGVFTFVSPSVEGISGYSAEDWLTHYSSFFTENPLNEKAVAYTEQAMKTGTVPPSYQIEIYHKDGSKVWLEVNEKPVYDQGKLSGIIGVARDITLRKQAEDEKERLFQELKEAMENIRTLRGMLPICSWCKKIRNDKGYWEQMETYISKHSDADFSHGLCPECAKKHYPEFFDEKKKG